MNEDPIVVHRLQQLEGGFSELRHEDGEMKKELNRVSSEVKLLAKAMSDLTTQIATLVKQNADRDSQRVEELREKVTQEGRFAKLELQLRILALISSAAVVALTGIVVNSLLGTPS